jgi:exonuclease III
MYVEMLDEINCSFDALCLQETWLDETADLSLLDLENYEMIPKPRSITKHGGFAIYLKSKYKYFHSSSFMDWEYQFIKVKASNKTSIDFFFFFGKFFSWVTPT